MPEFVRFPLGELMDEGGYIRGPFGSALVRRELKKSGVPVYEQQHAITGMREFRFFVDEEKYEQLRRFAVKPNDLIISCSGTVGRVSMIGQSDPHGIISQALLILRPDPRKIEPRFLRYFLESPEGAHELVIASHGTVQVNIAPREVVERISVPVPKLGEQRAIAYILGTLDDKVELNHLMNKTLEATASAVFKSWFVDFDPVRAKAGGEPHESICRRLRITPELLALFPDRLVDSALGEIPYGWEVMKIEKLLTRLSSRVRYTKNEVKLTGPIPVFEQGSDILLGFHDGTAQFNASPEDPMFVFGDHTCITHLACEPFDISQNVIPLKGSIRPTLWVFYAVRDRQVFQEYRRHWMELIAKDVIVAPVRLCEVFTEHLTPLHLYMEANVRQNSALGQTRDTLLPKLLTGEVPVHFEGAE